MAKVYQLKEGSIHEKFFASRAKIQFFGGGFGNGKTSAMVVKALKILKDYPGANVLCARSTYPKLNDTLRRTFIDFCPAEWIDSFPMSKNSENACTLKDGTRYNFRYVAQKRSTEDGNATSNLLSATYDIAIIDQIEDPEITYKDLLDILGRMRGDTVYRGDDPTMPRTGPRWVFLSANPTRNWVWTRVIAPLKRYLIDGVILDDLLCERDTDTGAPILDANGKPFLLIELVEGATYENAHVLSADFIKTLESAYKGQMKDRFLKGEWVAYEGLVYPEYNPAKHIIRHDVMVQYKNDLLRKGTKLNVLEGYDFGIAAPSCYLLSFVDDVGNIFVLDGFYRKEMAINSQAAAIAEIRRINNLSSSFIRADPDIFRRKAGSNATVGKSVADLFAETDSSLMFARGNNDIMNGIVKVKSYVQTYDYHQHPIDKSNNSPYIYFSSKLEFIDQEFNGYFWKTDSAGERDDKPNDANDHAMDTLKYMLSDRPDASQVRKLARKLPEYLSIWQEKDSTEINNPHRYRAHHV